MVGLTWAEVEDCERRYASQAAMMGLSLPTKDDFDNSDLNGDGILLMSEWLDWVAAHM